MKIDEKNVAADMVAYRLKECIALLSLESRNTTEVSEMVLQDSKKALARWEELK